MGRRTWANQPAGVATGYVACRYTTAPDATDSDRIPAADSRPSSTASVRFKGIMASDAAAMPADIKTICQCTTRLIVLILLSRLLPRPDP